MPKEQAVLLLHFLLSCLDQNVFPHLIGWVERSRGIFKVSVKRQNSCGWTVDHATHFMAWDQAKGRETDPASGHYLTNSRHRFKIALERMVHLKELIELSNVGYEDHFHVYQLRSLDHLLDSTPPHPEIQIDSSNTHPVETLALVHKLTMEVPSHDATYYVFTDNQGSLWWSLDCQIFYLIMYDIEKTLEYLAGGLDLIQISSKHAGISVLEPSNLPEGMETYGKLDTAMSNSVFDSPTIEIADSNEFGSVKEMEKLETAQAINCGGNLGHCVESPILLSDEEVSKFFLVVSETDMIRKQGSNGCESVGVTNDELEGICADLDNGKNI